MPLEAGDGFISGLVVTNPVNATDQVAQGDDHLRLIKTALKGSFPNVSGAVTATHTELNALDGVTASAAELNIMNGVTLTAAQINDAARLSVSNSFSVAGPQDFTNSSGAQVLRLISAHADGPYFTLFEGGSARGDIGTGKNLSNGADTDFGIAARGDNSVVFVTNDVQRAAISAAGVLTPNATASEVGYKGTPQNVQNGDYGIVLTDCGKTIYKASGGAGETITIPANGTIAIPVGTIIRVVNRGGGTLSIAITSDTLELAGSGTTGTRTLADKGVAVIEKVEATIWMISGAGVS